MNVTISSRANAEKLLRDAFPAHTAVISFYSPGQQPVQYGGKAQRIFYVCVHDIDIETLPSYGLTFETYFPEVKALADFILQAQADHLDFFCQCDYGQSRSAACASAILEYFEHKGITVFADYRYYPNQMIFNKVLHALEAAEC